MSWTVLPLVLPPFRLYSGRELLEVLFWQGMGLVGWPVGCGRAGESASAPRRDELMFNRTFALKDAWRKEVKKQA
jgi:hypothetical protein